MSNAAPLPEPPGAQPRRTLTLHQQLVSDSIANADPRSRNADPGTVSAYREARTTAEPPDLDPPDLDRPDSEWPEPEWPDPAWPGFGPGGGPPSYAFTLAVSPWFKERYPDKAANLWDALHTGRTPQPAPEPDRLADREAGE